MHQSEQEAISLCVQKYAAQPPETRKRAREWAMECAGITSGVGHPDAATREFNRLLLKAFEAKEIELAGAERLLAIDERRLAIKKELEANPLKMPSFRSVSIFAAKGMAISGGLWIAGETVVGLGLAARAWWALNGSWLVGAGCFALLLIAPISGLISSRKETTRSDDGANGETRGAKNIIINNIIFNGDGNTVAQKQE